MKRKTKRTIKRIIFIILGAFIMSLGSYFFLFAANIASGGVGGLALILTDVFPNMQIGFLIAVMNAILFVLGFMALGKEFGIFTLTGTAAYSLFSIIYDNLVPERGLILQDPLMNMLVGSALMGVGLALVFNQNASTGGTDILAKIISNYTSMGIGTAIMLADALVIILAAFIFGVELAIYGVISLFITSAIIDKVMTGFNTLIKMTIISKELEQINNYIICDLNRGTTLYQARGGYTKEDKEILVTIVGRSQYVKIKNFINRIDENAFVFVNSTNEVIGEGFTRESEND